MVVAKKEVEKGPKCPFDKKVCIEKDCVAWNTYQGECRLVAQR